MKPIIALTAGAAAVLRTLAEAAAKRNRRTVHGPEARSLGALHRKIAADRARQETRRAAKRYVW